MPRVYIDPDVFSDSELIDELEDRGYVAVKDNVPGASSFIATDKITEADLQRIEHLVVCGQRSAAIAETLELVSRVIGRPI